jgi:drug/metabolite transporter (DMT)-like permease
MPEARPPIPPWAGLAIAVASVSFAAPLFKLANQEALTASFWRLALATLLLLPFSSKAWPLWRAYSGRDWALVAVTGLALGAHFGLWVTSLEMTTVAASTTLVTLSAVFVAVGGHFVLRDRLSPANWLGVAVAVAGAAVIAYGDAGGAADPAAVAAGTAAPQVTDALLGDALALLAGLCSALYFLVGRRLRAHRGLVEYVTPVYVFAAIGLLAALPIAGQPLFELRAPLDCVAFLGAWGAFVVFVLLAAVPMLGGHTMANWTMRYLPAHTVATWILLEPVGAAALAWWISCIGETPGPATLVGGAIVLVGAILTVPRRR